MAFTDTQRRDLQVKLLLDRIRQAEATIGALSRQLDSALIERDQARDRVEVLESQRCVECGAPLCPRHDEHCAPNVLEDGWEAAASDPPQVRS